uniref:Uncharacterized protein n=1 Tax=Tetranychus urticae TaxID=32264 RepID=T1KPZ0_TETUR
MCFFLNINLPSLTTLNTPTRSTIIKLIWTVTILISNSSICQASDPEKAENDFSGATNVDTSDLYNICYSKLKYNLRKCLYNHQAAFADCVYNSMEKWYQLSDKEETKSSCCSFWEGNECLKNLVLDLCPDDESQFYFNDQELISATMELQNGYCSSYQQLSDCYLTFWPSVADPKISPMLIVSLSVVFSLTIIILALGFAVRYLMNRKKAEISDDTMKTSPLKQDAVTSQSP